MKRVDKRRVVASIVVAAAVLQIGAAGVAMFVRHDAENGLETERNRRDELEVRVHMAEQDERPESVGDVWDWTIEESADVSGTLQVIQSIGDDVGVELSTLKAAKSNNDGKQSFQITGIADPTKVCELIAAVERDRRLIVVETGRILPGTEAEVVFDLGLATYHQLRGVGK